MVEEIGLQHSMQPSGNGSKIKHLKHGLSRSFFSRKKLDQISPEGVHQNTCAKSTKQFRAPNCQSLPLLCIQDSMAGR